MHTSAAACKIARPQIETGSYVLRGNGLAIWWKHFINGSTRPFYINMGNRIFSIYFNQHTITIKNLV